MNKQQVLIAKEFHDNLSSSMDTLNLSSKPENSQANTHENSNNSKLSFRGTKTPKFIYYENSQVL